MRNQEKNRYLNLELQEFEKIRSENSRPSLLMHTCCGVCACYPINLLTEYFDLTLYFNNDNIYPFEEYQRRFDELVRYVEHFNGEHEHQVRVIKTDYDGENYLQKISPLKDEPERGARCLLCYRLRMESAIQYAIENGYDYFTTVMTISRQKDSAALNKIGESLQEKYPQIRYFCSDFKKQGGLEKGNSIANDFGMYRQNYCGCLYSYENSLQRSERAK